MISIVICSKNPVLLQKVSKNVAETIGVPYELVVIDNANGQYGICSAYNLGAKQSIYDILCFMHEDIQFHTENWGAIAAEILADKSIGLVGVTGSKYLVEAPAPWWGGGIEYCRRNLLEGYADNKQEMILQNPDNEQLADVVAVDGLWLCTRKQVWQDHPFDEKTFPYFHFYDIDFSAQIFQKYRVVVTFNILIEHFSRGNINHSWVKSALCFEKKWRHKLPMTKIAVQNEKAIRIKARAYQSFVFKLLSLSYNRLIILKYLSKSLLLNRFNRDNLWLLKQFLKGSNLQE